MRLRRIVVLEKEQKKHIVQMADYRYNDQTGNVYDLDVQHRWIFNLIVDRMPGFSILGVFFCRLHRGKWEIFDSENPGKSQELADSVLSYLAGFRPTAEYNNSSILKK